jgi:hypothetical protein
LKTVKQQINLQMNDNEPLYLFVCCSPYSIDFDFLCKLLHHTISISKKKKAFNERKNSSFSIKANAPKNRKKKKKAHAEAIKPPQKVKSQSQKRGFVGPKRDTLWFSVSVLLL